MQENQNSGVEMMEVEVEVFTSLTSEFKRTQEQVKQMKEIILKLVEKLNQTNNFLQSQKTEANTDKALKSALISHTEAVIADVNILTNIL